MTMRDPIDSFVDEIDRLRKWQHEAVKWLPLASADQYREYLSRNGWPAGDEYKRNSEVIDRLIAEAVELVSMVSERDAEWQERVDANRPTLRQRYAMAALTAIANDPFYTRRSDPSEEISKMIAKEAFTIADAMIAQEAKE